VPWRNHIPIPACVKPEESGAAGRPGVVDVQDWWPDEQAPPTALKVAAGVGRKL
jgi:hypothetical protein